jgi:hypothetical protein
VILRTPVAVTLAALVIAPSSDAAMCIRLSSDPPRPVLGRPAVIEIRTFSPTVDGGLVPWIVRRYPFRVEAVSPRGRTLRVKVKPSRDPYAWRGTFRFDAAGMWTVWVTNFGRSDPTGCGKQLRVRVRAR